MSFNSVKDICKEFNLDESLSIEEIIAELTKIQGTLHPDKGHDICDDDTEKFTRISNAKKFLRNINTSEKNTSDNDAQLISLSEIKDIIKLVKDIDKNVLYEADTLQNSIKNTSAQIIHNYRKKHLVPKITSAGIAAVVTFLWSFPAMITDHPVINYLSTTINSSSPLGDNFYLVLTYIWLMSLLLSVYTWWICYIRENHTKNILNYLENDDNQYMLFKHFIMTLMVNGNEEKTFTVPQLQEFLILEIEKHSHSFISKFIYKINPFELREFCEKISNIIIFKAQEKEIISKDSTKKWHDIYIVQDLDDLISPH